MFGNFFTSDNNRRLRRLNHQMEKLMAIIDDLTVNVKNLVDADEAMDQLLQNIKKKLDEALANPGGPDVAKLQELSNTLKNEADKITADVLANTPAEKPPGT